ncbi:LPS translocon maturation chaperone LptM [Pantoea agglomerans]
MNKMICRMALVLAVVSLAGCGLKGPLYFPPQEKPKQQTTESTKKTTATATDRRAVTTPAQNGTQSQPSTTEPETQTAQ